LRKAPPQVQAGSRRVGLLLEDPLQGGCFAVGSQTRSGLFRRRRPEVIKAEAMSRNAGEQPAIRWTSVFARMPGSCVLERIDRRPLRPPQGVDSGTCI